MYYNQSCAANGEHGSRRRQMLCRTMQRAAVNVYRTESSLEMLVFAPGRIKEHFKLDVQGRELTVSYTPPEGFVKPEWVVREYSRGGFQRTFTLDSNINTDAISARYVDGVLNVSLPLVPGAVAEKKDITVN